MQEKKSKQLLIYFIITILFAVIYCWGNLKCGPRAGGGDNRFCYIPMAAALLDDDPDTRYTCQYYDGKGVIAPLVYALAWKVIYDPFRDFDYHVVTEYHMPNIGAVLGAFYITFALFIFLSLSLRLKHLIVFLIAMAFYLQIDPFFEVLNNNFLDGIWFFVTAIGMYFLARCIMEEKLKDFCMVGIIWFVLPMVRANGLFYILCTIFALGIVFITRLKDKEKLTKLMKQSLFLITIFAICNIIYEIFIISIGWQPDYSIVKHHPLIIMFTPWLHFRLFGCEGANKLLNEFINITSLTDLITALRNYLLNIIDYIQYLFNMTSDGLLNGNLLGYRHCEKTVLHLMHHNFIKFPIIKLIIITINIIFLFHQIQKKDKVTLLMYLGALCYFIMQILILYEARYYLFIYFVLFYPFFWLLDRGIGMLKKYKTTPHFPYYPLNIYYR